MKKKQPEKAPVNTELTQPSDPEEREWRRKIQHGLVVHLNRLCIILSNRTTYEINPDDYSGLDNFTLYPNGNPEGETSGKSWITLDWGLENVKDYLREIGKNAYWVRYKYTSVIREAAMWIRKTNTEIKKRNSEDDNGE